MCADIHICKKKAYHFKCKFYFVKFAKIRSSDFGKKINLIQSRPDKNKIDDGYGMLVIQQIIYLKNKKKKWIKLDEKLVG